MNKSRCILCRKESPLGGHVECWNKAAERIIAMNLEVEEE